MMITPNSLFQVDLSVAICHSISAIKCDKFVPPLSTILVLTKGYT